MRLFRRACRRCCPGVKGADVQIWFLPLVAIMFIGTEMAVLSTTDVNRLWLVSASLGLAYGALFNVLPMLVLESFGMCASRYGLMALALEKC